MSKRYLFIMVMLMVFFSASCATRGPVVPVAPSVQVTQFDSLLFTPEVVKFQAILVINNRMDEKLNIQKIEWGADVNDKPVFTEPFTNLKAISGNGRETVTFPFQVAVKDIKSRSEERRVGKECRSRW